MRAVISDSGRVKVVDRDPNPDAGEAITVTSSGICGSDLHMIDMGLSGVVLGHEFGGRTQDGRLVTVRPTGRCGVCPSCQRHHSQTCTEAGSTLTGLANDGGLAEIAHVAADRIHEVPDGVSPSAVGLVEPLAVVTHGINRVRIEPDMPVLVVGAGSIGLLNGAVLRDRGARVDIVARHEHQRIAAEKMGLGVVDQPSPDYEITFDAVCTQSSFDTCVRAVRPGGQLVEFGMFWTPVHMDNSVMMKEVTVVPSIFYGTTDEHDDFAEAIDFLARNGDIETTIVTHRFPLEEAERAFDVARDKSSGAIKVHIEPTM